ncbi:MAG: response regulator [Alphaproteobacteria bacterium]
MSRVGSSILIVEDEPFIVESLRFLLEREGHTVQAVRDGAAAIAAIDRARPDLIVLDVMLPKRNGFEILKWVRGHRTVSDVPVLILTAKGQDADRRKAEEFGVDAFVTKPFSNRDVIRQVTDLLAAGRAQAAAH